MSLFEALPSPANSARATVQRPPFRSRVITPGFSAAETICRVVSSSVKATHQKLPYTWAVSESR